MLVRSGALKLGTGNSLTSKLDGAVKHFGRDAITPAVNQIKAFLHELDALVRSDRLGETDAAPLRRDARGVIRAGTQ